ncbi:MAG: hypothetical protein V2A73_13780 [Pseudomonadota bacterium]
MSILRALTQEHSGDLYALDKLANIAKALRSSEMCCQDHVLATEMATLYVKACIELVAALKGSHEVPKDTWR